MLGDPDYNSSTRVTIAPERSMALLLSRGLGHDVTPEQVTDLFRLHWQKLSALAHAIHDQQMSKDDYQWPVKTKT